MKRKWLLSAMVMLISGFVFSFAEGAAAYTIEPVSVNSSGLWSGTNGAKFHTSISHDGNIVAFVIDGNQFAQQKDGYNHYNLFYRNINSKSTHFIDLEKSYSDILCWDVTSVQVSGDGKFIIFYAGVTYLDNRRISNVYLYDTASDSVELIKENVKTVSVDISYDGRYSVFYCYDIVCIYDKLINNFRYINIPASGSQHYMSSIAIDDAGEHIVFNGKNNLDVYLYNTISETFKNIGIKQPGDYLTGYNSGAGLSANGKYAVLFTSTEKSYAYNNVYVYDVTTETFTKENLYFQGLPIYAFSFYGGTHRAFISNDGRYLTYTTSSYIGVLDRTTGLTRTFQGPAGYQVPLDYKGPVGAMTPDGRYLSAWGYDGSYRTMRFDTLDAQSYGVDAGVDQTVEQETTGGAYVSLHGVLNSGDCAGEQTYRWSWSGGETLGQAPILFLPPGENTITLEWSGCGVTASDTVNVTVEDTVPPSLAMTGIAGTTGAAGWYRSDVSVQFAATDNGSGVAAVYCTKDGSAVYDSYGAVANIALSGDGSHSVTCFAVDQAGIQSDSIFQQVNIDATAPSLVPTTTGKLYKPDLFVSDVTIDLSAEDNGSGVSAIIFSMNDGVSTTVTGSSYSIQLTQNGTYSIKFLATDAAGNLSTQQSATFSIDKNLLSQALVEELGTFVLSLPSEFFGRTNPNDVTKLISEITKVLISLEGVSSLPRTEQLHLYQWAKQKLTDKILPEFERMVTDPQSLSTIRIAVADAVAAIDRMISQL